MYNGLYNVVFATLAITVSALCIKHTALEVSADEEHWNKHIVSRQSLINLSLSLLTLYYFYSIIPPLIGKFRNPISIDDFRWYYAAGKAAHDGLSPYALDSFTQAILPLLEDSSEFSPFAYPPSIIPFIFPLSYLSYDTAARLFLTFDLISVIFLLYGATLLLDRKTTSFKIYCLCTCSLIYGVTWSVRLGNISVIVSSLIVWTVILAKNGKNALAGVLLGASMLKPTLSLLFMIFFLLKKRFVLLGWSLATALTLTSIGLWMCNTSVVEFVHMYRAGAELHFENYWNSIYTSPVRIDAGVIGPRIFPDNVTLANFISNSITLIVTALIAVHTYRSQKNSQWSSHVNLSEVSLIACLSVLSMYSQPQNGSILVLVAVVLLNYVSCEISSENSSWNKLVVVYAGAVCLMIHTHLIYGPVLRYVLKHRDSLSYLAEIGIVSIPNYAILGLTLSVLLLARRTGSMALPHKRSAAPPFYEYLRKARNRPGRMG